MFIKFSDRYSWKGSPLLFSGNPDYLPPSKSKLICKECGAPCVFELQLMPTLVYVLHKMRHECKEADLILPKEKTVEFGTVLIYSCSASCWEDRTCTTISNFKEELVIVQPDIDTVDKLKFN